MCVHRYVNTDPVKSGLVQEVERSGVCAYRREANRQGAPSK
jgi:hypothetical protein